MTSKLFAAATALLALALPAMAQEERVSGLLGEDLGTTEDLDVTLGGTYSNPFQPHTSIGVAQRGVYRITLNNTGTGWQEDFLLMVPKVVTEPVPLLVAFHGYSRSPDSILYETRYLQKARRRGWYAIAPMAAHEYSFSIPYAQQNVEAVLEWAVNHLYVDTDRIYGVGFSMGGGMVSTYAARHQDPNAPRFAAIVNHTGTVSMRDVYNNSVGTGVLDHPEMFGGSPDQFPFLYAQASAIDINALGEIDMATDFSRHLLPASVFNWYAESDPLAYLINQTDLFHGHLTSRGVSSILLSGASSDHSWSTLSERAVFQFLQKGRLTDPSAGTRVKVLADRDANYYNFDVTQRSAGEFTRFDWRVMTGLNRLFLESIDNLDELDFDLADIGLDGTRALEVIVKASTTDLLTLQITGFAQAPSDVLRGASSVSDWSYDAGTGVLTLLEYDPSTYQKWTVIP